MHKLAVVLAVVLAACRVVDDERAGLIETDRSLRVMNLAVAFCGYQPDQIFVQELLLAAPSRVDESAASAICAAVRPRGLILRGVVLPEVDGVPVRGRFIR